MTALPVSLPRRHPTTLHTLEGGPAHAFVRDQWARLYTQDPHATSYQAPGWTRGWAAMLPPATTLLVLVAENPRGDPEAALALQRDHNAHGRPRLRPLGTPHAEYIRAVGPGSDRPPVAAAFAQYLIRAAHEAYVVMPDLPSDTRLGRMLAEQPTWQHTTVQCATVPLPVNFAAMSRSTRREHARRERAWTLLSAQRRVEYARTTTSDDLAAAVSEAQHLHRRRWAGHPMLPSDGDQDGLLEVLRHCGPEAFAATLSLDGSVAAAMVCLDRGDVCYSLLPAMDIDLADLAVGHALTRRLAADLTLRGYSRLDLGRTLPTPGQHRYKNSYRPLWTSTVTATGPGGAW
ncbi:GNAT family N-acetyltransferase [Streptomyces sp. NEAU-S7GS2]|uniref:GNAT family N-acetyltransferase n=1 Tax=Streptomyces sp. NEAU-S7GS2 TaxID=2202000 RepID=UPI0013A54B21|nr:GNAT family N-acetyltransferase [Streptomyces sp. NEAU-S7GS2]